MSASLRNIGLVLALLFLLPAGGLTLYELSNLRENEAILEEIYTQQLEAILFSVNQYGQDVADSWVKQAGACLLQPERERAFASFTTENQAISWSFLAKDDSLLLGGKPPHDRQSLSALLEAQLFAQQEPLLRRLQNYLEQGYQKLEPLNLPQLDSLPMLLFLIPDPGGAQPWVAGLFIQPDLYVEQVLAPRMQEVAKEQAIVFVAHEGSGQLVYSTESFDRQQVQQRKPLWLLQDYSLGILLKGPSLEGLAERRSYFTLSLIIGLSLLLLIGVVWVFRNVRKELRLAQLQSDFVSNVSHEIRTPLALISMYAETLSLGRVRGEEKKQDYYRIIGQETQRLGGIVNKLLNFSRMEAGKRVYQIGEVDLAQIAREVLHAYDFHLSQQGFSYQLAGPAQQLAQADKEAVAEALINLLDNAIKYSQEEKEITLRWGAEKGHPYLEVEDKGIGIPENQQEAIFEKFHRVASGPVHDTQGTGLGLALVRHIMHGQGGQVEVWSRPGKGSRFRLVFRK
jgi:two-component system phosphate regulon sensor histidine kinase PhoR